MKSVNFVGDVAMGMRDGPCPSCGGLVLSYTYDQLNRPVNTTQSFDGKAYTLDYAYDAVGNRTAMATPWGKYNYTYDALNRLTNIVNPQGITVAFGYDAAGRRTSKKIFKAAPALLAEAEYNYDAAGQLTEITNKAGGKVVAFNKYQYDANGNRNRIEDQDGIWDYKYDAANRLIVAIPWPVDYVKAEAFVYDKNGNRRYDKTAWDYHYDAANRLVENSTYTYTHDQNGNLTARTNRFDNSQFTYAYTPEQQLSDVTTPEHKVQYKYDPLGRRTAKTVDGKTIKFIYDGQDIISELDDNASPINTYTNGPGIDEPLIMTKPDGKAYYYHADALGSIKAITDDSGKTIETYKYKAYGQPTIKDAKGHPIPTSIIGNTRMFAAREYEQEIELYNNRRRYLDPSRGAFTQEDPIGFNSGDTNLYLYAENNPELYSDSDGTISVPFFGWVNLGECSGERSAEWYADRYNDSGIFGKLAYGVGGLFASLWTPSTSNYTALTLSLGYVSSQAMKAFGAQQTLVEFKNGTRWFQIRPEGEKPYFRFDIEKGKPHYHRRPDLTLHRPWDGKW